MTLILVTGLSGTGKTAVLRELRARGCAARGVDEDGYGEWVNRVTGCRDPFPRDGPGFDFHAWYAAHYWVFSVRRISVLRRAAERCGQPVFLCGYASGYDIVWQSFDKTIALVADEQTIRRRLGARPDAFGKAAGEIADVLAWQPRFEAVYRGFGATVIDATRPVADVAAEVLAVALGAADPAYAAVSASSRRTSSAITDGYSSGA